MKYSLFITTVLAAMATSPLLAAPKDEPKDSGNPRIGIIERRDTTPKVSPPAAFAPNTPGLVKNYLLGGKDGGPGGGGTGGGAGGGTGGGFESGGDKGGGPGDSGTGGSASRGSDQNKNKTNQGGIGGVGGLGGVGGTR